MCAPRGTDYKLWRRGRRPRLPHKCSVIGANGQSRGLSLRLFVPFLHESYPFCCRNDLGRCRHRPLRRDMVIWAANSSINCDLAFSAQWVELKISIRSVATHQLFMIHHSSATRLHDSLRTNGSINCDLSMEQKVVSGKTSLGE